MLYYSKSRLILETYAQGGVSIIYQRKCIAKFRYNARENYLSLPLAFFISSIGSNSLCKEPWVGLPLITVFSDQLVVHSLGPGDTEV